MTGYEVVVKGPDPARVVAVSEALADHVQIGRATARLCPRPWRPGPVER